MLPQARWNLTCTLYTLIRYRLSLRDEAPTGASCRYIHAPPLAICRKLCLSADSPYICVKSAIIFEIDNDKICGFLCYPNVNAASPGSSGVVSFILRTPSNPSFARGSSPSTSQDMLPRSPLVILFQGLARTARLSILRA